MLEPGVLTEFRKNVACLHNRAIFEIPEILAELLEETSAAQEKPPKKQQETQTIA